LVSKRTDIDELAGFIARASTVYAQRMVADIFAHAEILTHFPKAGRKIPERNDARYREVQVPPFRLIYKLEDEQIKILTVIHSRRSAGKIIKALK